MSAFFLEIERTRLVITRCVVVVKHDALIRKSDVILRRKIFLAVRKQKALELSKKEDEVRVDIFFVEDGNVAA